jgi:hypothetical protein
LPPWVCLPLNAPAFAGHTTGRAQLEHPAFRLVSPLRPRKRSDNTAPCDGTPVTLPSRCGNSWIGNIRNHSGFQTFVNDRSVALSPAHQKQGPFPPPTLLGLHGRMTLSDFRAGHHPIDDVEGAIFTTPGYPAITQIAFLACRAHYPGGSNRCDCRFSSLSVLPSPVNGRVGIHDFTFGACSSFTRVTACRIACPPKGGLLSRGFDPASCPTKSLGSYHVLPTTTWVDPSSTGDLRRWGALLTV